jgi:peptidoglycan/xylan/chitin deacetylase (PgdA/CDA1 family)
MSSTQPATEEMKPWQWPDETWQRIVGQVRAGRALAPAAWPGGARFAVGISFDSDHETGDLREGGKSISRQSWGQYGARRGIARIMDILARTDTPASFYVPAVVALLHPDEQRRAVTEGHEVGIHGWIHELNSELARDVEYDLMARSAETLERITGTRPVGLRTPSWDYSPHTLQILLDLGLFYDSSLMADDDCYELVMHGAPTGLVELPVQWVRDDAVYFGMNRFAGLRPYTSPREVLDIFLRELDGAEAEGGIFQLTMHPHIIGQRSRIWILEEVIRAAKAKGGWFGTHEQIARYAAANAV